MNRIEKKIITEEQFDEQRLQANSRDLFVLACILTICILALGNLYRSYEKSQGILSTEISDALGTNQKMNPKHAPEIGY